MKAIWTIGAGGVNCPSPIGTVSTLNDKFIIAGGNPWLTVGKDTCFIRAKNTYTKPVLMPF